MVQNCGRSRFLQVKASTVGICLLQAFPPCHSLEDKVAEGCALLFCLIIVFPKMVVFPNLFNLPMLTWELSKANGHVWKKALHGPCQHGIMTLLNL